MRLRCSCAACPKISRDGVALKRDATRLRNASLAATLKIGPALHLAPRADATSAVLSRLALLQLSDVALRRTASLLVA